MRALLDLDGVIANFYKGLSTFLNENYNCTLNPDEDPTSYSFNDWGGGVNDIDFVEASMAWIAQGGFSRLPAYEGAEEFVKELMSKCDVSIVTARIGDWDQKFPPELKEQIKNDTSNWLKQLGIPNDQLFFTHEKVPFCKEHGISVMIEDKLSTALEASKNGIHTILMHRGYNGSQIDRFKIYRAFNFDEALEQLGKLLSQ